MLQKQIRSLLVGEIKSRHCGHSEEGDEIRLWYGGGGWEEGEVKGKNN